MCPRFKIICKQIEQAAMCSGIWISFLAEIFWVFWNLISVTVSQKKVISRASRVHVVSENLLNNTSGSEVESLQNELHLIQNSYFLLCFKDTINPSQLFIFTNFIRCSRLPLWVGYFIYFEFTRVSSIVYQSLHL